MSGGTSKNGLLFARVTRNIISTDRRKETTNHEPVGCYFSYYLRKVSSDGRLVLDYALDVANIVIATEVQQETVLAGLAGGYPDAAEIKARIDSGQIEVRFSSRLSDPFEEVLDLYGLHEGDKAVIRLSLAADVDATITDDRLLFVVLRRCGREAMFLPDFVEKVVADGVFDVATGQKLLLEVRPRLPKGFVEHSIRRLEGVI